MPSLTTTLSSCESDQRALHVANALVVKYHQIFDVAAHPLTGQWVVLSSICATFRLSRCLRLGSCCWGLPAHGQTFNNNAIGGSNINIQFFIDIQLEIRQPLQSIERVRALPVGVIKKRFLL